MKKPRLFTNFNLAALPRQALDLMLRGANFFWSEQYRFQQTVNFGDDTSKSISKTQLLRGRMADNLMRKISINDIDSRPIAYVAMNFAESVSPFIIRAASKASSNPIALGSAMAVAALLLDETTRSMITEQITNLVSLFSSQTHDIEDQINLRDELKHTPIKPSTGQP